MCSFLLTNIEGVDFTQANELQRLRGPDLTNVCKINGFTFVHNLLSITGAFAPQPFIQSDIVCMYNGQIYNHANFGTFASDGQCLIPAYQAGGASFLGELDGEFAISLVDWKEGVLILATDVFGTKPLHYAIKGTSIGVSSYASALAKIGFGSCIKKVSPNTCIVIDLSSNCIRSICEICRFSTAQIKSNFDDWIIAFQNSISKRTYGCREKIFIGLSSGYDSGAIACELNKQKRPFKSYSIMSNEDVRVIEERVQRYHSKADFQLIYPSADEKRAAHEYIESNLEPLSYDIRSSGTAHFESTRLQDDGGANGLSIVCAHASNDYRRIYLSGQGADEIISDYGYGGKRFYPHSNFGGQFPDDLELIFPWASFFGSSQAAYLMKEEYVAGAYGIEARYPFLDKALVQEFLSLSSKLKNWKYKSVLRYYLEINGCPCAFDQKFGFIP
jgi:asparagine synthetase B (glutamine-hydrolysing)